MEVIDDANLCAIKMEALGAVAAFAGLTLSFVFDLPGGPTMATSALFPMLPAWIYRKIKR